MEETLDDKVDELWTAAASSYIKHKGYAREQQYIRPWPTVRGLRVVKKCIAGNERACRMLKVVVQGAIGARGTAAALWLPFRLAVRCEYLQDNQ